MKKVIIGVVLAASVLFSISCARETPPSAPEASSANETPSALPAPVPPQIDIPEGSPVIYERLDYIMRGEFDYLYIYRDGSVIYIEEKGLRLPSPGHPPTRTWKTGQLQEGQLEQLISLFQSRRFAGLAKYYQFPGKPLEGGGFTMGDGSFTFTINYESMQKTVTAFGYLTPDKGETYLDMPSPLDELYVRLRAIALRTEEVFRENIS